VELSSPNGGECLLGGSFETIQWRADPSVVSDVIVEYSLDGGASWNPIVNLANTEANYQYQWNVPAADSQQCLVRVSDAVDPGANDVSDNLFSITTLVVPNVVGMTQTDAETAIIAVGLTVGAITYEHSDEPAGNVISQQPPAGTPTVAGAAADLVVSAGAKAAAAPVVKTESATAVGSYTATLNGKITDDGGGGCQYRFCYWKSGDRWISRTSWAGYATAGQTFGQVLTGLRPGSKYYYWAEAKNAAGAATGWDSGLKVFTTAD
jgi:hypothetical protein